MIRGTTELIAHIGFPTHAFKSPLIYNPYFEEAGIDAVVVPLGCRAEHFPSVLRAVFTLTNTRGALITMPHKVAAAAIVDEASPAVRIAGSCNAVRRLKDGRLHGDLFDGEGFVKALSRKGCEIAGARAFVVGAGGVGAAIAASLAAAGVRSIALWDIESDRSRALVNRLGSIYPNLELTADVDHPSADRDIVVNATPMGMNENDPLPVDIERVPPAAWVGDVVMTPEITPLLNAARPRGCRIQVGTDMLFGQIPAYLEYFGFPTATPERLRQIAEAAHDEKSEDQEAPRQA